MDNHCSEAVRQYRWAMLEASRHISMEKETIKQENIDLKREQLQELKFVEMKIDELEDHKKSRSRRFSRAMSMIKGKSYAHAKQAKEEDLQRRMSQLRERRGSLFENLKNIGSSLGSRRKGFLIKGTSFAEKVTVQSVDSEE